MKTANLAVVDKTSNHNPSVPSASGFDEFIEDEGIDLRRYWRVIYRHKWGILGLAFAVGLFTIVYAFSLQPIYRSSATLLIGGNETVTVSSDDEFKSYVDKSKFLGTQFELLKSRKVAAAVLDQLGSARASILARMEKDAKTGFDWRNWIPQSWLDQDWVPQALQEFARPNTSPDAQIADSDPDKALFKWLSTNLYIQPVRDTSMVKVSFETTEPELAARVANAFTKAYLDFNLKQRAESTGEASQWLEEQLEKSERELEVSTEDLQQFREQAGLVDVEGMNNVQTEKLNDRTDALSAAQQRRSEAENLYRRAARLRQQGQMESLTAVLENPWIQRLRDEENDLERQIRTDSERYQGNYPGLDDSRINLQAVRDEIEKALDKLVEGYKTDYEIAWANEARLQAEVKELEAGVQNLSRDQLKAQALEHTAESKRESYETFLSQLMETRTRSADTVSMIARVIDTAVPDFNPVKPKKKRMLMISLLLALLVGIGIALMLDRFDNTLKTREDVEERLGVPVLGELISLKGKREDGQPYVPATQFMDEPTSSFAESMRTIRTGVILSGLDQSRQTLVVTSTVSGEGKSTVAFNLALALAQLGKVLLIDADMRRPSLAKLLGQDTKTPGLTDLVAGTARASECIHPLPGDIHILFAGSTVPPDPLKILSSERFSEVLAKAGATYDTVVIDSAPVELVSDARILATKASGVAYVIKADETVHQAVRQGLAALIDTGTPLLGVILNQIDPNQAHAYGKYKYGYSRYGRYSHYSYGHTPKS